MAPSQIRDSSRVRREMAVAPNGPASWRWERVARKRESSTVRSTFHQLSRVSPRRGCVCAHRPSSSSCRVVASSRRLRRLRRRRCPKGGRGGGGRGVNAPPGVHGPVSVAGSNAIPDLSRARSPERRLERITEKRRHGQRATYVEEVRVCARVAHVSVAHACVCARART